MTERVLVVVPTYNERINVPQIVPAILSQDSRVHVLVVDDNSPDGTGELADQLAAENPRVHVLHRGRKEGLGKAYLAGFRWALDCGYDLIFEMDADFSHDPRFLPTFLDAIQDVDLVIGSRYKSGVNVINWPISRLLLSIGDWSRACPSPTRPAGSSAFAGACSKRSPWSESARTATLFRSR